MSVTYGRLCYYIIKEPKPVKPPETDDQVQENSIEEDSTESGWDNPFRPDGDLSREADEIVSQIKCGKPITPTPGTAPPLPSVDEIDVNQSKQHANNVLAAPGSGGSANGTKNGTAVVERNPGTFEVQRSAPQEPQQPERVTLKKKPKCKCCVIQ